MTPAWPTFVMSSDSKQTWTDVNKDFLDQLLEGLCRRLRQHAQRRKTALAEFNSDDHSDHGTGSAPRPPEESAGVEQNTPEPTVSAQTAALVDLMDPPPPLYQIVDIFGLSSFERDVLLLCAGIELDARLAPGCASAQGDPQRNFPTFSLSLAALPEPHWSALSPLSPLRYWRLIHTEAGRELTRGRLTIDERILHFLVGVNHLDAELAGLVRPLPLPALLPDDARSGGSPGQMNQDAEPSIETAIGATGTKRA